MLQRIQTVYLLIAAILSCGMIFIFHLWTNANNEPVYAADNMLYLAMFFGSAALSLIAIFNYKNRKFQFVLGRINIILNFILLGLFIYLLLMTSGESEISEKGVGIFIPIFSIVFLVLANKAIKKDEDLVKSVDRLR